ncbi:MAG: hypothetical protein MK132_27535, partial [Lentisphaerales bacterium]|nr:hypothetical protein [Lentisphaerales bacterium]
KQIDKDLKALNQILSEHKRSAIFPNMMNMLHNGMITKEDLEPFSDELKELLERVLDSFR